MKRKLFVFVLALTAVTSAYAAHGKGYHEYGEEIHSAPGFNFHVEEVAPGTTAAKKKVRWAAGQVQMCQAGAGE